MKGKHTCYFYAVVDQPSDSLEEMGTVSGWYLTEAKAVEAAIKEMKGHTSEYSFLVLKVVKRVDPPPEGEPVVSVVK